MGTFTTVYSFSSRYRLNNMETNEQQKHFEKEEQENKLISAIIILFMKQFYYFLFENLKTHYLLNFILEVF